MEPKNDPVRVNTQTLTHTQTHMHTHTLVDVAVLLCSCAGVCSYEGRGGLCSVRLSVPLLKLRPRKDLVETLLVSIITILRCVMVTTCESTLSLTHQPTARDDTCIALCH